MTAPGTLLAGKYELLEIAGKGGMATVWRARLRGPGGFQRPVAIKMMLPRLCNDPHFVALFVEEARVCSKLSHPNVTQIFEFGSDEQGVHFLAMEWVDGMDLLDYARSFIERGFFTPWAAIAMIGIEVLKGLHAAHGHAGDDGAPSPIFHRDVTPHNILLGVNGAVKLTDFGLAKAGDRGSMTLPHVVKGKISYTAPEMTRGVKANARTDLFALGVTLWEALAGRKMFDAPTPLQIVRQIQAWNIPALGSIRRDLPPELVQVVAQATARDPEERFASAAHMARALARVLPAVPDVGRLGKSIADARARLKTLEREATVEELSAIVEELSSAGQSIPAPAGRSAPPAAAQPPAAQPPVTHTPAFSLPSASGTERAARRPGGAQAPQQPAARPTTQQNLQQPPQAARPTTQNNLQQPPQAARPTTQNNLQQPPQAARPTTQHGMAQPPQAARPTTQQNLQQPVRPTTQQNLQQPARPQVPAGSTSAQQPARPTTQQNLQQPPQATRPVTQQNLQQPPQAARPTTQHGMAQPPQAARPVTQQNLQQPPQQPAGASARAQGPHSPPMTAGNTGGRFPSPQPPRVSALPQQPAARPAAGPPPMPGALPGPAPAARPPARSADDFSIVFDPSPVSAPKPPREDSIEEVSALLELDDLPPPGPAAQALMRPPIGPLALPGLLAVGLVSACASSGPPAPSQASTVDIGPAASAPGSSAAASKPPPSPSSSPPRSGWTPRPPPAPRFRPGGAQPSPAELEAARVAFAKGRELMQTGNYRLACDRFNESFKLAPALGTLLNLAICEEQSGERDLACQHLLDAADWAADQHQTDRENMARSRATALGCSLL